MYLLNLGVTNSDSVLNKVNYSLGFVGNTNTPPISAAHSGFLTTPYSQGAESYMGRLFFTLGVQF